ncbi:MAG: NAD(+) kinase [Gammaproteobacteria bacterium]|nr:NAD(+) kinase [Gammaproteobacteria bacterium]
MSTEFHTIGLMGRTLDPLISDTVHSIAHFLRQHGRIVLFEDSIAPGPEDGNTHRLPTEDLVRAVDMLIAVGGDGTMLHASRPAAEVGVPLLGVNRGRLGFLADVTPDKMLEMLEQILSGQYFAEERQMLHATLENEQGVIEAVALNDVCLQRWDTGRMLDFETWINGRYVNTHGGDGLVVATATGSTGYALSCGGPILQPDMNAVVMAPICPHTLSDRPIVVSGDTEIVIRLLDRPDTRAQVTCDGLTLGPVQPGKQVTIKKAERRVTLLHPEGYDYYRILRSKLHWGRSSMLRARPED